MAITAPNHSYGDKSSWQRSISNTIPALLYWSTLCIILSILIYLPLKYWIVVNLFCIYNLYFFGSIAVFSVLGIKYALRDMRKDHHKEYLEIQSDDVLPWESTMHYVVIANYKEDLEILKETMDSLAASSLAKDQMIIVLAMEERENGHEDKASSLIKLYQADFKEMFFTSHPSGLKGEFPGKASNISWALVKIQDHLTEKMYKKENVLITISDADSNFHKNHFENLNLNFCKEPNRQLFFWQSPMISYRNYQSLPLITKMITFLTAIHELAQLADPTDLHHLYSTYHIPYTLAELTGGMDGDAMAEDHHFFIKAFFSSNGQVRCKPLHIPIGNYAVDSTNYWEAITSRIEQAKRHLWGGIKCWSYIWYRLLTSECTFVLPKKDTPRLPFVNTIRVILKLQLLMYDAAFSGILPIISSALLFYYYFINEASTAMASQMIDKSWFFQVSSMVQILLILGLPLYYTHWKLLHLIELANSNKQKYWRHVLTLILGFSTIMPFVSLVLGTIPTFWAVTRLVFTENYRYVVAPKPVLSAA